jgi:hypothetical protein
MGFKKYRKMRENKLKYGSSYWTDEEHPCCECGKECSIRFERCYKCHTGQRGGEC